MSQTVDQTAESSRDPLNALLASANPVPALRVAQLGRPDAFHAIRNGIMNTGQSAGRQPWSRRAKFGALVAGVIVMVTTGAATFWVSVHTGLYGHPNTTEEDGSEWLNVDSPEIIQVIDRDTKKYSLPPAGSWSAFKADWPTKEPMRLQATGIEGAVAWESSCQWRGYWLAGYQAKNPSQMSAAQAVLDQVPNWSIMRNPKAFDASALFFQRTVAQLAAAKNATEFQRLYEIQCASAKR